MKAHLTIGRLAAAAGCTVQTIRYYEQIGLLQSPHRSAGNHRLYGDDEANRLSFIRHARELGFPLDAIRDLLALSDDPGQSCETADGIAREQLVAVESRIQQLQSLKKELERMIAACRGGAVADCRVIEVLGDHALCRTHDHGEAVTVPR